MALKSTLQRAGLAGATLVATGLGAMANQNTDKTISSSEIRLNEEKLDKHFLKDTIKLESERLKKEKEFNKIMGYPENKNLNAPNVTENSVENDASHNTKRAERAANRLMEKIENGKLEDVKADLTNAEQNYARDLKDVIATSEHADNVIDGSAKTIEDVPVSEELVKWMLGRENLNSALSSEKDNAVMKARFQKIMQEGR